MPNSIFSKRHSLIEILFLCRNHSFFMPIKPGNVSVPTKLVSGIRDLREKGVFVLGFIYFAITLREDYYIVFIYLYSLE